MSHAPRSVSGGDLCRLDRARHVAHLAAASKEIADLIEERLAGQPSRPTRFELVEEGSATGDAVVSTDPAHRLLVLGGRRSATHLVSIEADQPTAESVSSILWPAVAWR